AKIADATRKRQTDRNDEARKLMPQAKKEINSGNYELAADMVGRLVGELADTDYVKSNMSTIKGYKKICDERARVPGHILVEMDFEDYPGSWILRGNSTGGNPFEKPHQGRRPARRPIPSGSRVSHLIGAPTPKADSISFWARTRGKTSSSQMNFYIHDDSGQASLNYVTEVTLTPEWKQHPFRFTEFRAVNAAAKGTL